MFRRQLLKLSFLISWFYNNIITCCNKRKNHNDNCHLQQFKRTILSVIFIHFSFLCTFSCPSPSFSLVYLSLFHLSFPFSLCLFFSFLHRCHFRYYMRQAKPSCKTYFLPASAARVLWTLPFIITEIVALFNVVT